MMAVYRSAAPGGKVDARLSNRAASGANETTPSDGGFLVQQDFVSTLLKRTYETGILASKVKKIPISSGSNGLKINSVDEESRANGSRWGGIQTYWEGEADEVQTDGVVAQETDWSVLCNRRTFAGCRRA
jgi:HK97 family phage major capsid protein